MPHTQGIRRTYRIHPSRTRSPTAGPYIDIYSSLPMSVPKATSNAPDSTVCPNPFCTNSATMPSIRCDPTTPDASLFPPVMIFAPDMAHSMTFLESLDSERAAVPAATVQHQGNRIRDKTAQITFGCRISSTRVRGRTSMPRSSRRNGIARQSACTACWSTDYRGSTERAAVGLADPRRS